MKRISYLILAIAALSFNSNLSAQYLVSHAKSTSPGQQNGIYYSLPQTVLRVDFTIEESTLKVGPYSEYVDLVGANDYVSEDKKEYALKGVSVTPMAEADPNATFFVTFNSKKGEMNDFYLTPKGILSGVGQPGVMPETVAETSPVFNFENTINQDFKYYYGPVGMNNEEDLARDAAEMIATIRQEKLKLLTGYQETAFLLDTYKAMFDDLDAMEAEYLSLFIGKRISTTYVRSIYVTPSKEVTSQTVAKFSKEQGLVAGTNGMGTSISVQALSLQTTGSINQLSQSAVESLSHENKLFYRIPEVAQVKVTMGNQTLCEGRQTIAQYGVFMLAPLSNSIMTFDSMTGQIVSIGSK